MENQEKTINLKALLASAAQSGEPSSYLEPYAFKGAPEDALRTLEAKGFQTYRGKVRECLSSSDKIYLIHTDNLSAFDRFITMVPFKGVLLAAISRYWYEAMGGSIKHAYLASPHPRILEMKQLQPVKVEVIVRAYLAGSMLRSYQTGVRNFCGQQLPDGLQAYDRLPKPIVTPTSKAEAFEHDENKSPAELIHEGHVANEQVWAEIEAMALQLFQLGSETYDRCGWIFADTKYEFGTDSEGHIYLIDEVHTPDSSRLWKKSTYHKCLKQNLPPQMFDKELVRRYLSSQGFLGEGAVPPVPYTLIFELLQSYLGIYESLAGEELCFSDTELASVFS
ncbi:MAG: phosphoribosylaminoimidazolesuccinocarboxamide synthase [Oligoflexales bacterium]|nr:phosphoribosylaminoimidazolesuccinocarboxamide synthase [Oligoflexales bacterium]